jgi:uncharacterized protein YqjF (DUF2071 family)
MQWLTAGYQSWRELLFVHWPVPAAQLRPLVPPSMTIDQFDGSAYVGLVPFVVEAARPVGVPPPFGLRFLETNVRTYVHLDGREPGVYFFSLNAASLLAVVGARLTFGLPYFWATGEQRRSATTTDYRLRRRGGRRPGCRVRYRVGAYRGPARPGSLDHFLIERYLLHVQRGPSLWTVRVRHHPYPLYGVTLDVLQDELVAAARIGPLGEGPLIHLASGVDVAISAPHIRSLPYRTMR